MSSVLSKADDVAHQVSQVGQNKIANNSHPLHPSTVHWPLGLLSFSYGIDVFSAIRQRGYIPALISKAVPPTALLHSVSHVSLAAGLVLALPSVTTGLMELYEMWRGQALDKGFKKSSADAVNPKVDDPAADKLWTTIRHAGTMDAALLMGAYNWWTRRTVAGFATSRANVVVSTIALGTILYGGYLGGHLVYEQGVGVQRQGTALEFKRRQEKSS